MCPRTALGRAHLEELHAPPLLMLLDGFPPAGVVGGTL